VSQAYFAQARPSVPAVPFVNVALCSDPVAGAGRAARTVFIVVLVGHVGGVGQAPGVRRSELSLATDRLYLREGPSRRWSPVRVRKFP